MEIQEEPLPLLTLSNGHHTSTTQNNDRNGSSNSDSESQDSLRNGNNNSQDSNRFNSYLNRGSELWTHWTWLGGQGKMSLMRCNYCLVNKQLKNAPKCRRHLIKCQKTPEVVRKFFERKEIEASRVSAFMREIRSKEVKFPRNQQQQTNNSNSNLEKVESKSHLPPHIHRSASSRIVPKPTANDLKHLNQKQQQQQTNGHHNHDQRQMAKNPNNGINNDHNNHKNHSKSSTSIIESTNYSATDLMNKTSILMNYSPLINRSIKNMTDQSPSSPKTTTITSTLKTTPTIMATNPINMNGRNNNNNNQLISQNDHPNCESGGSINYNHLIYQLMSMNSISPTAASAAVSATTSPTNVILDNTTIVDHHNNNNNNNSNRYPILSGKLKRKHPHSTVIDYHHSNNGKENSLIVHEPTKKLSNNNNHNQNGLNLSNSNNTVVINLDDMSMISNHHIQDDPIYFNQLGNGHEESLIVTMNGNGHVRKRKRDNSLSSPSLNNNNNNNNSSNFIGKSALFVRNGGTNGIDLRNNNNVNNSMEHNELESQDIDILHDDLNDLLMSALISHGIELDFIKNSYFEKFISQLLKFSTTNKNYHLPSMDTLVSNNILNLIRKFDYETAKIFSECDSIIVSFENNDEHSYSSENDGVTDDAALMAQSYGKPLIQQYNSVDYKNGQITKKQQQLNVNLMIASSNTCLNLFYKSIVYTSRSPSLLPNDGDIDVKHLNNQIDSLFNKLGPDRINAVILPYKADRCAKMIHSYLTACHSHIVPLTNSYRLFHQLLCDICRIPSIHRVITKSMILFQDLLTTTETIDDNQFDFHAENQNHWKQVFESDKLGIFRQFIRSNDNNCSIKSNHQSNKNTYWISLNMMFCWLLVARSSIMKLFEQIHDDDNDSNNNNNSMNQRLKNILQQIQLEISQMDQFFNQISILFNFLTPFINAMHLIENESTVISDIIKIYYDVKLAINNNNFFNGIQNVCDKTERQTIDSILHGYLNEQNFSRYYFLAYYLDPRFREDRRIEENEELTAQVYDALFTYAQALGCVNNEEEDREKLVDSLEEFRNGDKLYGMQLLKCPKSPSKFWKHLRRFPGSAKLAYCASRLLSISTRSMLMAAPPSDDPCVRSLCDRIINHHRRQQQQNDNDNNELDHDCQMACEKLLPIRSYLLSSSQKMPSNLIDGDGGDVGIIDKNIGIAGNTPNNNGKSLLNQLNSNISQIIFNVINSLDQYRSFIAQPFSTRDLSTFFINNNHNNIDNHNHDNDNQQS